MSGTRARGFSLLELMVVVTIIGIFVGVAVLSVDVTGNDRDSEQEVFRLKNLIELLREESLLQGLDYGVLFHRTGYQFYYYDYDRRAWLLPAQDRILTERTLPETLDMSVIVDDREVILEDAPVLEAGETGEPQVLILASGEMTPFSLEIFRDALGTHRVLTAEFNGDMEISVRE